jgi:ABC-type lipoprotein release transport system permease subunit
MLLASAMGMSMRARGGISMLVSVAAIMTCVGLLAALGPARRGLCIQPTEALKDG